ncbi:MAG TPA: amidase [Myxococcota bacterium]|jgi:plastocyanin|nr:amidase [Myxococcota bacterium]
MLRVALFVLGLALLAAPALADGPTVSVSHNHLAPSELKIAVGTTVTFVNEAEMPGGHTIVADDGSFESPALAKGASWSHTFTKPGTVSYSIKEHPTAKGTIVVQ